MIPGERQLLGIAVLLAMVVVIVIAGLFARRSFRRRGIFPGDR